VVERLAVNEKAAGSNPASHPYRTIVWLTGKRLREKPNLVREKGGSGGSLEPRERGYKLPNNQKNWVPLSPFLLFIDRKKYEHSKPNKKTYFDPFICRQ
jgi:hypothetical protein